jgi:hypothetical protein
MQDGKTLDAAQRLSEISSYTSKIKKVALQLGKHCRANAQLAQLGRALVFHTKGHGFESCIALFFFWWGLFSV